MGSREEPQIHTINDSTGTGGLNTRHIHLHLTSHADPRKPESIRRTGLIANIPRGALIGDCLHSGYASLTGAYEYNSNVSPYR